MKRKLAMTAAFVVALAVAGYAQKPDFSGAWAPEVDPAAAAGGGGGGRGVAGRPRTVYMTANRTSVGRQWRTGARALVYKTDGWEFEVAGRGGARMKATAKWRGSKLVITTKTGNGDQV